jgi:thioredoxin
MAFKFTDNNFEEEALKSEILVLVDFYADWCGPCKMMGPVVEELAEEFQGKVKVGKIDVDENRGVAATYKVMTIPTLMIIKDGVVIESIVGVVSKEVLTEKLNNAI